MLRFRGSSLRSLLLDPDSHSEVLSTKYSCFQTLAQLAASPSSGSMQEESISDLLSNGPLDGKSPVVRLLIDHMPNQIFWKDLDSVYQGCNRAFAEVVGLEDPNDVVGMTDFDFCRNSKYSQAYRSVDKKIMLSGEPILDLEEPYTTSTGKEGTVLTSKIPLKNEEGRVIGLLGVCVDITERNRAHEELQRMHRLKDLGVVAGGIAHDFNNLLGSAFGQLDLASMKLAGNPSVLRNLEAAQQALNQAKRLTTQMLTFARGGAPQIERTPLAPILEDSIRSNLSEDTLQITRDIPEDLWAVQADPLQLYQVFSNLLLNARKAVSEAGHIEISAENSGSEYDKPMLRIQVKDNGCGIEPAALKQIFAPYFHSKDEHYGLGLAVVHNIVLHHKGHIEVSSELGKGSCFTIDLPADPHEEAPLPSLSSNAGEATAPLRVLVMDDDDLLTRSTVAILEHLGCSAVVARNGDSALQSYQKAIDTGHPFDLTLMDLTIQGGKGGEQTMKELLVIDPDARVVVVSGYADSPVMANSQQYGFKGRLNKPYSLKELQGVMAMVTQSV